MRIVLATRHATDTFVPLALMYLKAALLGRGSCRPTNLSLLEFGHASTAEEMAGKIVAARPDVVALSCYVWNGQVTLEAARRVKALLPNARIVLGGPEVGPIAAAVLARHPCVDAIVYSEGEVPLPDIVDAWQKGRPLRGVRGIAYRDGESVVEGPPADLVKDLDDYPSPHLEGYIDYRGRVVCIETQRGCVFQCNFCFYNKDYSLRNRRFALERVKEELLIALGQDAKEIYLMDPVFNLNAARAKEICRFIAEHNDRRIPIHSEIWAEFVDDEMAQLMRAAGFQFLEVGLQTTDETALATTERRLRLDRFNEGISYLRRHQLQYELQLIYGLPAETRTTFRRSLNFAMALNPPELSVFLLLVLPGTELWRKAADLDLAFDPEPPYPVRSHRSMTAEDISYGRRLVAAVTLLQGSRTIRLLARERGLTFADIVDAWIAWRPDDLSDGADAATMRGFVARVCEDNRIPPDFYREFAAREFGPPRLPRSPRVALATRHADRDFIPLALMYLKASMAGRGSSPADNITLVEFARDATGEAIAADLLARDPDVVGLSCYVWNITALLDAARRLRAAAPDIRIVLGGPEVGPVAADVLRRHPYIDAVVKSEGEVPFADIIEAWQANQSLDRVPGIAFRHGEKVVDTGAAALVKDLNDYPSPHLERYVPYAGRVVCVETQRGCVFECNFCFYNKDYSLRNRRFALDRVKEELMVALTQDVQELYLMDPVFNLNVARAKEICRFIAAHNERRIPIHSEIWAEFVDDELASLMRAAGFAFLEVGLQTTDEKTLAAAERRLRLERFNEGIAHLRRHQLRYELQLIYGLPGETRATFKRSLNFAMALDPPDLAVFRLMVLPGTELWRKAESFGLTFDPDPPYHVRAHLSMTEEDIEYGHRLLKSANLLQGSRTVRFLAREPGVTFADIVDNWVEWRPGDQAFRADNETLKAFVSRVCAQHAIPTAFYQRFGALEFS